MKKQPKTSQEVRDLFVNKKNKNGVIAYKGGFAVVINSNAKEIFVGKDAKINAEKRLKELSK